MWMRKRRLLFLWVVGLLLLGCGGERAVQTEGAAEIPVSYVALTFDDGPHVGTTDRLLDGLLQRGASATFFLVGEEAEAAPQLVCRMKAESHQIGNHTWSHMRLESPETAIEEVGRTETLLESLVGGSGYWLRPPYGQIADDTGSQISVPMVTWSVDPRDWESRDTEKVVQAVLENVKPNSIILLHDIYPTSVDAALQIVDTLQGEGYCFVTVEELLLLNGVTPQAGTIYRSGEAQ
jgi:peptidoglycan/xylan/chitin deacetylase (PgdA/CDA1 family)